MTADFTEIICVYKTFSDSERYLSYMRHSKLIYRTFSGPVPLKHYSTVAHAMAHWMRLQREPAASTAIVTMLGTHALELTQMHQNIEKQPASVSFVV